MARHVEVWRSKAGNMNQLQIVLTLIDAVILYGFFVQYRDDKQRELEILRRANEDKEAISAVI